MENDSGASLHPYRQAAAGFIGQQSMHARRRVRHNAVLEEQGFENAVRACIAWLQGLSDHRLAPVTRLAMQAEARRKA